MRRKIMGLLVVIAMCFSLIPANCIFAATVITDCKTGNIDGYDYELWKDYGNTSMTLNGGTKFSCQWNSIGNALFRIGKKFDSTKTYQQLGNISVNYACDYKPDGNSYLCVYGWTKSPLVEYYVVDSWGTWRPPGATAKGQITVDGGTYDVYETTRVNQPSIEGNTTFKQYWSVRTSKRTSGTISLSEHFKKWESMGLQMGKMYEAALTVEGYQSNGSANVTKNDIVVGGSISQQPDDPKPENPTTPAGNYATLKEGWYYIKDNNSQKYLQVKGNTGADGQNVEIGRGTGSEGQKWYLKNVGDGYVTLKNGTGYALDIAYAKDEDNTNVQVYSVHGLDGQLFKLLKTQKDGVYGIVTKCSTDTKGLDVEDKSTADGANVQQYSYYGGDNQVWVLEACDNTKPTQPTQPTDPVDPVTPSTGNAVTGKITSDWGSGAVADITVTNNTGKDLNNWTCTFTTSRPITSVWNATIVSQSGNTYTVTGPAWQANLQKGASYTFGCQLGGGSGLTVSNGTVK